MNSTIYWDRKYFEDIGEKGDEGLYDYAYCYFDYWFNLPNNESIRLRKYTDTPEKCTIFGIYKQQNSYEVGVGWEIIKSFNDNFINPNVFIVLLYEIKK